MQIDGKEFKRDIEVDDCMSIYCAYFSEEYLSAGILWKESERNSKQIGHLTCLNHPSKDGTNPHWQVILEVNQSASDKVSHVSLDKFVEVLKRETPVKEPIWIELREFKSITHEVVGDLWNND
jgi:hypothetical protein